MTYQHKLNEKIALACTLTDQQQIQRMNELHQTLFQKIVKIVERKTSFILVFQQGDDQILSELIEFIQVERLCCPWLKFTLTFPPAQGLMSLQMGNSAETKKMVKLVMELDKLHL